MIKILKIIIKKSNNKIILLLIKQFAEEKHFVFVF